MIWIKRQLYWNLERNVHHLWLNTGHPVTLNESFMNFLTVLEKFTDQFSLSTAFKSFRPFFLATSQGFQFMLSKLWQNARATVKLNGSVVLVIIIIMYVA